MVMNPSSLLIVGGEASADHHGARVMRALRRQIPSLHIFGVGGQDMRREGMEVVAEAEQMAVAGLTEVLLALPRIIGIQRRLLRAVDHHRPSTAVLIDHPDFNLRLARNLKKRGISVVYFISPQVWAWRQSRIEVIQKVVDKMLVILPFEEGFYARHGVAAEFVGHPLVEELRDAPTQEAARVELGLPLSEGPVIALLPGSRRQEIRRHLPVMLAGVEKLRERYPSLEAVVPLASTLSRELVDPLLAGHQVPVRIVDGHAIEVLAAADAAVVCSGTASLQAALLEKPIVVVYRVSWLSYQILRRMVSVAHIAMVNLIAGRELIPELIQNHFTPAQVYRTVVALLDDSERRNTLVAELRSIREQLGRGGGAERVAEVAMSYIGPDRRLPPHPPTPGEQRGPTR